MPNKIRSGRYTEDFRTLEPGDYIGALLTQRGDHNDPEWQQTAIVCEVLAHWSKLPGELSTIHVRLLGSHQVLALNSNYWHIRKVVN